MQSNIYDITDTEALETRYVDPNTARIIIDLITDLRRRTSDAEEQLQSLLKEHLK